MRDRRDGDDAIAALDGREFGYKRRRLRVEWAKVGGWVMLCCIMLCDGCFLLDCMVYPSYVVLLQLCARVAPTGPWGCQAS